MSSERKRTRRAHFAGLRRDYCGNRDCPFRNVFYSLKKDSNPDAAAVCPRLSESADAVPVVR